MKITVVNTKGGVSKTTTTIMLASVLSNAGFNVLVWDADPQGGASLWGITAEENDAPLSFEVIPVNRHTVKRPVPPAFDFVLVDTAPGTADIAQVAVESSDMSIIPTLTSNEDIERTLLTLEVVQAVGTAAHVLITQAERNTLAFRYAVEELKAKNAPLLESVVRKATGLKQVWGSNPEKTWGYEEVAQELGLVS